MTPNWKVDDALRSVQDNIAAGAWPLRVSEATLDQVRRRLKEDFQKQHKKQTPWHEMDKNSVLPLSNLVGWLASILTFWDWWEHFDPQTDPPMPSLVKPDHVYMALTLVASKVCFSAAYCEDQNDPQAANTIGQSLAQFLMKTRRSNASRAENSGDD